MSDKLDAEKVDSALKRAAHKAVYGTRAERAGWFAAPKAFISYSHDSADHKAWVLKLATDLRAKGVDVVLDQWDLAAGQDVAMFMQRGISEADRVIMVCSLPYVSKSENGIGGAGYERLIVTSEVVQSIDTTKFIPILRHNDSKKKLPTFLGPRLYIDFENETEYEEKLIQLAREIHNAPAISKPPLGPNPFLVKTAQATTQIETLRPTGWVNDRPLFSDWFSRESERAADGLRKVNLTGYMELRGAAFHSLSKSQIELLNAVKQSEIKTFGWPIGITLENQEAYRPRPYGDGIKAEVAVSRTDRTSFDYWALRSNGDFYLRQSLFEDTRKPNTVFFDTRIVRVTESLMFLQNLYMKLGFPPDTQIAIQVMHGGLAGRELTSASPNRWVSSRTTTENQCAVELLTALGKMNDSRVDDVRKILEPMFILFDFMQFNAQVYEEIVRNFERGVI